MPRLSANLLPTTTMPTLIGTPEDVTGAKVKGNGYYGFSDGLHTIAHFITGFVGTLEVQGTLASEPADADWVTIDLRRGAVAADGGWADALISDSQVDTTVPALAASTYDFDVTIDGGAVQQLSITVTGTETYAAVAALMSTAVVGGIVTFINSSFRVTSSTSGITSAAVVAVGTLGSASGDLFAAIEVAETETITYPTPVAGVAGKLTEDVTYNFTGNFVWVRAIVTDLSDGTITKILLNH